MCDLALLTVEEDAFWVEPLQNVEFVDVPELQVPPPPPLSLPPPLALSSTPGLCLVPLSNPPSAYPPPPPLPTPPCLAPPPPPPLPLLTNDLRLLMVAAGHNPGRWLPHGRRLAEHHQR